MGSVSTENPYSVNVEMDQKNIPENIHEPLQHLEVYLQHSLLVESLP